MTRTWATPTEWRTKLLIIVLTAIAMGTTYRIRTLPDATEAHLTPADRPAPDFSLSDTTGAVQSLRALRGKAVILNFMATWCGPCGAELPVFEKFAREHADDPIVVMGVDFDEPPLTVARFAKGRGLSYPILVDEGGKTSQQYGVVGLPTTYFIDEDGKVRGTHTGTFEGVVGDSRFRHLVDKHFGQMLASARQARRHCTPASTAAGAVPTLSDQAAWALSKFGCACGCGAKLLQCDCAEPRGGREIRLYYTRLCEDRDLTVDNVKQILLWKYKDPYVW